MTLRVGRAPCCGHPVNLAGDTIRMTITANSQAKDNDFPIVLEAELSDGTFNEWFGSVSIR